MVYLFLEPTMVIFEFIFWTILLQLISLSSSTPSSVVLQLSIPVPGGLVIDKAYGAILPSASTDSNGDTEPRREIFRVGRNQHSTVSVRPDWKKNYIIPDVSL